MSDAAPPAPRKSLEKDANAVIGLGDSCIQKVLRAYGRFIGRHPTLVSLLCMVFCIAVSLGGWLTRVQFGGSHDLMTPLAAELQWSVAGGKLEKGIRLYHEKHGVYGEDNASPWGASAHITMFVNKNDENSDVMTREALLEVVKLTEKLAALTTVVDGLTYTWYDICSRGILPDVPSPTEPLVMPCLVVSPLLCFSEAGKANHPSYRAIDPIIDQIIPGYMPYSTRPSIATSTDAEIKSNMSQFLTKGDEVGNPGQKVGCVGHAYYLKFFADLFTGNPTYSGSLATKAEGFRIMMWVDAPARIKYRMSVMKPEHANLDRIQRAMDGMNEQYHEMALEFGRNNAIVEVSNMDPDYGDSIEEEMERAPIIYLVIGGILNSVYCGSALLSYRHPQASRANVGFNGLFFIMISEIAAFGVFFICGFYMNGPMMIAIPLLALGIGLDDMFVVIRYYSSLGSDFMDLREPEDILGETLACAGLGTTLTSLCNVLAFSCGVFLPIPAMSDFCMAAVLVALMNWITNVHLLFPQLYWETIRIKTRKPDPHFLTYCCHRRIIADAAKSGRASVAATSAEEFSNSIEKRIVNGLRDKFAPCLVTPTIRFLLTMLGVGGLIGSFFAIRDKDVGWAPAELVPTDHYVYRAMELTFAKFTVFGVSLTIDDIDFPANQIEILKLVKDLTTSEYVGALGSNFLSMMYTVYYMGTAGALAAANITDPAAVVGAMKENFGLDQSWTDPLFAPMGTFTTNSTKFYELFNGLSAIPDAKDAWLPQNLGFVYMDMGGGVNEFHYKTVGNVRQIDYAIIPLISLNLATEATFLVMIQEINDKIAASPLSAHTYAYGPITTFWEAFLDLEGRLYVLMAADFGIIFVITLLFFELDILTAIITAVACAMIVIEAYGLACLLMNFNVFVAAISLMAMGMSVEFTAHLAAAFSTGKGSAQERLGTAMAHTFPALMEGIISTACGIVPLAFHPARFTVKYLFGIVALVVAVGSINGFVIMPGMLAFLSPCFSLCKKKDKEGDGEEAYNDSGSGSKGDAPTEALKDVPYEAPPPATIKASVVQDGVSSL